VKGVLNIASAVNETDALKAGCSLEMHTIMFTVDFIAQTP
jgi:hypothetical protein